MGGKSREKREQRAEEITQSGLKKLLGAVPASIEKLYVENEQKKKISFHGIPIAQGAWMDRNSAAFIQGYQNTFGPRVNDPEPNLGKMAKATNFDPEQGTITVSHDPAEVYKGATTSPGKLQMNLEPRTDPNDPVSVQAAKNLLLYAIRGYDYQGAPYRLSDRERNWLETPACNPTEPIFFTKATESAYFAWEQEVKRLEYRREQARFIVEHQGKIVIPAFAQEKKSQKPAEKPALFDDPVQTYLRRVYS